jgi:hypothetical protein
MLRSIAASALLAIAAIAALPAPAEAQRGARINRADLADEVAGTYHGDVISDARGSSRSGVTVTVAKVGPNLVEVSADYPRIPTVRIPIEQAMNAIVQARGDHIFVINRDVDPRRLDLTIDDASLSLTRR